MHQCINVTHKPVSFLQIIGQSVITLKVGYSCCRLEFPRTINLFLSYCFFFFGDTDSLYLKALELNMKKTSAFYLQVSAQFFSHLSAEGSSSAIHRCRDMAVFLRLSSLRNTCMLAHISVSCKIHESWQHKLLQQDKSPFSPYHSKSPKPMNFLNDIVTPNIWLDTFKTHLI